MVIDFDPEIRLIINQTVINDLLKYKQGRYSKESGGVLLGKKDIGENTYYITDISKPSIFDRASFSLFEIKTERNGLLIRIGKILEALLIIWENGIHME